MDKSNGQFGLIVAYLLPGFIGLLAGIAPLVPAVAGWLTPVDQGDAGFGPPVYALLAATAVGMIVSCFRWLIVDHVLLWTGIKPPKWNFQGLDERLHAFNYLVENHYRYYQHYAGTFVAVLFAYLLNRLVGTSPLLGLGTDLATLILCAVLFLSSRDSLKKYYDRVSDLIGPIPEKGSEVKTHDERHRSSRGGNPET